MRRGKQGPLNILAFHATLNDSGEYCYCIPGIQLISCSYPLYLSFSDFLLNRGYAFFAKSSQPNYRLTLLSFFVYAKINTKAPA